MSPPSPSIRLRHQAANLFAASVGWLGRAPGRMRILAFHDVSDDGGDDFGVCEARMADFLSLLKDEGYTTLRAGDLLAGWPSVVGTERAVLLTFDDGYAAQRDVVADLLKRFGMTATFFVLSSLVGERRVSRRFAGADRSFLSADDLRQMDRDGFEIGSHSHTHPLIGRLPPDQVEQELRVSKQALEQGLGHAITSFAYPYGRRGAFSAATRGALERAGYRTAFTMEGLRVTPSSDLLRLPRTSVDRLDSMTTFRRKLEGYYDLMGTVGRYGGTDRMGRFGGRERPR